MHKPDTPTGEDGEDEDERIFRAVAKSLGTVLLQPAPVPPRRAKRSRAEYRFLRIPVLWVEKLAGARHVSTLKLSHHLLAADWSNPDAPIKLSNGRLAAAGVSRWQKWRALVELESLGLIFIERRARKSPVIALFKS